MKGKAITKFICIAAIVFIIIYDVWIYKLFSVEATISRVTIWFVTDYPGFGILLILAIGFLLGHLLWGQRLAHQETVKEIYNSLAKERLNFADEQWSRIDAVFAEYSKEPISKSEKTK